MNLFTQPWESSGCVVDGVATLRCIWPLFHNIINAAITLSAFVAMFFIIFSGIRFITSRGDAEGIQSARNTMIFAIIGLVFIVLAFFIFNFVLSTVGINPEELQYPAPTPTN